MIWFVSAAHGRPHITDLCLEQRAWCQSVLAGQGIPSASLIVADDENLDIARGWGCETLEHPNRPLAQKWNAGFRHACREGASHVVYIGSDDWLHPDFFHRPMSNIRIVSGRRMVFCDLRAGIQAPAVMTGRAGVIPWIIPAGLLARVDYAPIQTRLRFGMDNSLIRGLTAALGKPPVMEMRDPHPWTRIDWKTEHNITTFQAVRPLTRAETPIDWAALKRRYPTALVNRAQACHQTVANTPITTRRPCMPTLIFDGPGLLQEAGQLVEPGHSLTVTDRRAEQLLADHTVRCRVAPDSPDRLTRTELNELAHAAGIINPEGYATKAMLIGALTNPPEPDEESDGPITDQQEDQHV